MTALLCIDVLGTKAQWRRGGSNAALALWEDFADLVTDTAASMDEASRFRGEIDSDSCVIHCPDVESALSLGRRIFRRSWLETRTPNDMRLWLRGLVAPSTAKASEPISVQRPDEEIASIRRTLPAPAIQGALAALRSGYRGMRIMIDEALLSDQLRGVFRIPLGRLGVIPFRRMNFTPYPPNLKKTWQDFWWMAEGPTEWAQYTMRMKQRMLWSAGDHAEFVQAAATQVVFHEIDAILQSVTRKNSMRRDEGTGRGRERDAEA